MNLTPLPKYFRILELSFDWSCDHGDNNPGSTKGWHYEDARTSYNPVSQLGSVSGTNNYSYSYDYDGTGSLFRIEYSFQITPKSDLSIDVVLTGKMYDNQSNNLQAQKSTTFNVPLDGQATWTLLLEHSDVGYHNGQSNFNGTASNSQQTS